MSHNQNDNFVKVTGTPFVRDIKSMGLSNVDNVAKEEYYNKKALLKHQKDEINKIREEFSSLRDDFGNIKDMLQQILQNQTKN